MHLVFRLSDAPLRIFDGAEDPSGHAVGRAVVGGARSTYYVRDVSTPSISVGAMLRPGAAQALFGAAADELAQRHTQLDDLWGAAADLTHEQLSEAGRLERRLAVLESVLARKLSAARGVHPAVAYALERFEVGDRVDEVVAYSGYSHRHFLSLFRTAVGLAPKAYCRVRRFRCALRRMSGAGATAWADVAVEAGYSDQAHFNREFLAFAGVTPTVYRGIAPAFPSHVAVAATVGQIFSRRA